MKKILILIAGAAVGALVYQWLANNKGNLAGGDTPGAPLK